MRLVSTSDSTVEVVNDLTGEILSWDVSIFDRTRLPKIEDVFRDINAYWKFIGQERQQRIWDIYKQIHAVWYEVTDSILLAKTLMELVMKLYNEMPQDELEHWVKFHAKVHYQDTLQHQHDPEDPNPGRTYLYSDYQGLVVLTIAVRPMVPIWGEYISRIKKEVGGIYKEYNAMRILARTWVIHSPYADRLRLYIESSNLHNVSNVAAILSGLGTDQLPEFLLSFVIVRRIAVGDIDATSSNGSIISNIYGFISSTLTDFDRRFDGMVKEKYPEDAGNDDEGSMMEAYKVKQHVTIGEVATFSAYVKRSLAMAVRIDPTISEERVVECVQSASTLQALAIHQHHVTLCQWVLAPVMPPKSIPLLNKSTILQAMGVTQALLWHWGFPELACLVTASKVEQERELTLTNDVRTRISNEQIELLNKLYPYTDPNNKQGSTRQTNYAYKSALALTAEISKNPWEILAPAPLRAQCPLINARGIMSCPVNIVDILVSLIVRIHTPQPEKAEA